MSQPACRHPYLKFVRGGLGIACEDCGQQYHKSYENMVAVTDMRGEFDGFTENDRRCDPFALPRQPTKKQ